MSDKIATMEDFRDQLDLVRDQLDQLKGESRRYYLEYQLLWTFFTTQGSLIGSKIMGMIEWAWIDILCIGWIPAIIRFFTP